MINISSDFSFLLGVVIGSIASGNVVYKFMTAKTSKIVEIRLAQVIDWYIKNDLITLNDDNIKKTLNDDNIKK